MMSLERCGEEEPAPGQGGLYSGMSIGERIEFMDLSMRSDIADLALRVVGRGVRARTVFEVERNPSVILDICSGTGSILLEYARRFPDARIITVDRDHRVLAFACERFLQAGFKGLEAMAVEADRIPLEDGSVDVVNISFGLHESDGEGRSSILSECFRLLKSGGQLIVTDYREVNGLVKRQVARVYFRLFEPPWVKELFRGGLQRQVASAGFDIERVRADLPLTQLITARRP